IILCGGAVLFWALFTTRWRDALRLLHPAGIITFCVTALPWYILCASRNPDFFRVFIVEHNFKRYLTPEFQHIQPFWFYVPILALGLAPWVFLLLATRIGNSFEGSHAVEVFLLCFLLFTFIFFSASQSKLPGYILPAIPPVSVLIARAVANAQKARAIGVWAIGAVGSLFTLEAGLVLFSLRSSENWVQELQLPKLGAYFHVLSFGIGGL